MGKIFKYTENGLIRLLKVKTAYIISSSGGYYLQSRYNAQEQFLEKYLKFLGVSQVICGWDKMRLQKQPNP